MASDSNNQVNTTDPSDPSELTQGSVNYKSKLDQAALKARQQEREAEARSHETLLDKVAEYVPVVGKLLHHHEKEADTAQTTTAPGPPERPHHDQHIEEFIRDAHRSIKSTDQPDDSTAQPTME